MTDPSNSPPGARPDQTPTDAVTHAGETQPPSGAPIPGVDPDLDFLSPPARPGELGRIGHYRVLRQLGRGGMGVVLLAEDTRLERQVAIKVMLPVFAAKPVAKERFLREARAAAAVKHDNVVTIYQVDEERGTPFIAMEFLKGLPLDAYLEKKGSLPVPHTVRIGREIAAGLAAAHEKGLVHRDIKPANVWLEAPVGRVKLLDFGLARRQHDDTHLTSVGAIIGTPAYMAPEQARGEPVDHRTDLFSLGAVLYRLATGRLPFPGRTVMEILTALAVDEPAPAGSINPHLPPELTDLIRRLLAKKPDSRPQSAREVARTLRALERAMAGGPTVVVPVQPGSSGPFTTVATPLDPGPTVVEPPDSETPKPRRRRRTLLAVLAGALVLMLGGIVVGKLARKNRSTTTEPSVTTAAGAKGGPATRAGDFPPLDPAWVKEVQALPGRNMQLQAVFRKLRERNRGFNAEGAEGKVGPAAAGLSVRLSADHVVDLTPLQALPGLRHLVCAGSAPGTGQLASLRPLEGVPLLELNVNNTRVEDLSPLAKMPLTRLELRNTPVRDLRPLAASLIESLDVRSTRVADFTPLKTTKLKALYCDPPAQAAAAVLASIPTLVTVNDNPRAELARKPAPAGDQPGLVRKLPGHEDVVRGIAFLDGRHAVSVARDGTVRAWDVTADKPANVWGRHPTGVNCVTVSPDGRYVLTGGSAHDIKLWDAEKGKELHTFQTSLAAPETLAFSPDGASFLSPEAKSRITLWNVDQRRRRKSFQGPGPTIAIVFLPDGKSFLSAHGGEKPALLHWDLDKDEPVQRYECHEHRARGLAWLPSGRRFVTAGPDGTVQEWQLDNSARLQALSDGPGRLHPFTSLAVGPGTRQVVTGSFDGVLRLWDLDAGKVIERFRSDSWSVNVVAISRDGKYALSGGGGRLEPGKGWVTDNDYQLRLWRLPPAPGR